ncbi:MAG: UDP-N-acetylmuramyl pentapeptide phosphotransferase/UDP-N-acetylglucosamine-1-phosphate transferase [candidate division WWE3 bacterium GW2011_GWC1_41_7]|uniref:UDP-N-acetylmuramyl pentapeptide phosphotransferase/UDP-N-acetylglucosamine-1-phosphate transferase n=4 Tax=Katanobacteria TaxID=422282 RepID=A0A0G0X7E1_UNCKA|nr:MAG: UDP-N-acetylmuramyl pentapeptide phosphotransferase/UDP-N-acetylglucosamine-1-phosphate transferase [candidate division WWE3 bacterium GW2011_GWC1_41_7]OGC56957.1 MAG: hypothetical protein A2976_03655 [candidate division WWE3 bacterium RIFCSPLOWO2_01_FULL_41_9]
MKYLEITRLIKRYYLTLPIHLKDLKESYYSQFINILVINTGLVIGQLIYVYLRLPYLNENIPFWYSMPWGSGQLAPKSYLYLIPVLSVVIFLGGVFLTTLAKRFFIKYLPQMMALIVTVTNIMLTYSLLRIVFISSIPFPSLINPLHLQLFMPFIIAFVVVYFIAPYFIEFARDKGIVTNPSLHSHPAMVLLQPSTRGGGVVFTAGFLLASLFFVTLSKEILGIYLVALLLAILGLVDDYQNTHPRSFFRFLETPVLRLVLLFGLVSILTFFNVQIDFIGNPFGGIVQLTQYSLIPAVITVVWIVWILNLLSWSNGIDGQYSGIIGISSIVIAFLSLRFIPLLPEHMDYAKLAIAAAGASFGLVKFTWNPSKIMWGFSAMSAGVVLAALSVLISSKIAASILIVLIPFLDAVVTIIRRLLQGKNPLKGDKGHLHHLLLERGWSIRKIAVFYWASTAFLGLVGLWASEKYAVLITLTLTLIVASFIVLLNWRSLTKRRVLRLTE